MGFLRLACTCEENLPVRLATQPKSLRKFNLRPLATTCRSYSAGPTVPTMPVHLLRRRANARNVSFRISLRWLTYIVNSVDKTKLSCNTPTDAAPQFL